MTEGAPLCVNFCERCITDVVFFQHEVEDEEVQRHMSLHRGLPDLHNDPVIGGAAGRCHPLSGVQSTGPDGLYVKNRPNGL